MYNSHNSWYSYFSDSIYFQFTQIKIIYEREIILEVGYFNVSMRNST
jgi:hypothetical protein